MTERNVHALRAEALAMLAEATQAANSALDIESALAHLTAAREVVGDKEAHIRPGWVAQHQCPPRPHKHGRGLGFPTNSQDGVHGLGACRTDGLAGSDAWAGHHRSTGSAHLWPHRPRHLYGLRARGRCCLHGTWRT
jgi:hypothetical protein